MGKTAANTAPTFTRNNNVVTASWTIQSKAAGGNGKQQCDWRCLYAWGWESWHGWKDLGVKATSTTFTFPDMSGSVLGIEVKTRMRGLKKNGSWHSWSDATSAALYFYPPAAPSLSMSKDSSNKTTFSWSLEPDTTGQYPFYSCYYCTWDGVSLSSWTPCAPTDSRPFTETRSGIYRTFYIYAKGWGGNSAVVRADRYIGPPAQATWASPPFSLSDRFSHYDMTLNAKVSAYVDQIDTITPQYYIGMPTENMVCPSNASWKDGVSRTFGGSGTYALPVKTDEAIDKDECLWVRIKTEHDGIPALSGAYRAMTGVLKAPRASITIGSITAQGFSVFIDIEDDGTDVPGAYKKVYLEKASKAGFSYLIGTIPNGTSSATITSTMNLTSETGLSIHIINVTKDGSSMKSAPFTYSTSMPTAPVLNSVTQDHEVPDKVFVAWEQRWARANRTVIAWTDDPDNWMSNDEPDTYEVTETASGWYIVGLETGKKWYFRVRSLREEGESVTSSPWSNEVSVDLSSAPAIPVLYLSEDAITEDGMVSAYWVYASTDGTPQVAADIVEMTLSGGAWVEGDPVIGVGSAQHVDIYAKDQGWHNGDVVYLALRTRSGSGGQSEYSTPTRLVIAEKPTVAITTTSLVEGELTELPMTVTVTNTATRELSLAIERAADYPMILPDGTETPGTKGETIYLTTERASGSNSFEIKLSDCIGRLDDRALYKLVATATDEYGQIAEATLDFKVNWTRQAWTPSATIVPDPTNMIVRITPEADMEVYEEGDTCDIYRLSVDGAELIYAGAEFGTEYVDPYPAFGEFSGYRIATITANGDYITDENDFAVYDTIEQESYTPIESSSIIIDFGESRVELPYNISLSNSWSKDFKRTVYLGGHTAGDHNKVVTRDLSASSLLTRQYDPDGIQLMRGLSRFADICHVRTPDGSSFAADVQVSESMSYDTATADYSLTIQRVDSKGYEGMTYEEWSDSQ